MAGYQGESNSSNNNMHSFIPWTWTKSQCNVQMWRGALLRRVSEINLPTQPDNSVPPKKDRIPPVRRKKSSTWTKDEHRSFLLGLKKYGKGDWKSISRCCVMSKTSVQVASHAQKYFLRQNSDKPKKRASIHDMTLEDDDIADYHNPEQSHNEWIPHIEHNNSVLNNDLIPHVEQHGLDNDLIPHIEQHNPPNIDNHFIPHVQQHNPNIDNHFIPHVQQHNPNIDNNLFPPHNSQQLEDIQMNQFPFPDQSNWNLPPNLDDMHNVHQLPCPLDFQPPQTSHNMLPYHMDSFDYLAMPFRLTKPSS